MGVPDGFGSDGCLSLLYAGVYSVAVSASCIQLVYVSRIDLIIIFPGKDSPIIRVFIQFDCRDGLTAFHNFTKQSRAQYKYLMSMKPN